MTGAIFTEAEKDDDDQIRRDFLNALRRLKNETPNNDVLLKAARLGKLKINPTTVALEAGHSRTLIGHAKCKYPLIRADIESCKAPRSEKGVSLREIVASKRRDTSELKARLRAALTHNAALIIAVEKYAEQIASQKRRVGRKGQGDKSVAGTVALAGRKFLTLAATNAEKDRRK